jgi:hypothetical protein
MRVQHDVVHDVADNPARSRRAEFAAIASLFLLLLAVVSSCTTTTEPLTFETQLGSSLAVSPTTVRVGDTVNAHWTIRNVSHTDSLFRLYRPGPGIGLGLILSATPEHSVIEYQSGGYYFSTEGELILAPREMHTIDAVFKAVAAGTATVDACLPPFDGVETEWTCERQTVIVTAH